MAFLFSTNFFPFIIVGTVATICMHREGKGEGGGGE